METKTKNRWVNVRLSEEEYALLDANARKLGANYSELIRALIRTPIALGEGSAMATSYVGLRYPIAVIDAQHVDALTRQVRHYGHHYNQAVRALNTIASKRFMRADLAEGYMQRALMHLNAIDSQIGDVYWAARDIRDEIASKTVVNVDDWSVLSDASDAAA